MSKIKDGWEKFLDDGDKEALYDVVKGSCQVLPVGIDYPYAHRICDIELARKAFRVVRLADENESLYIYPCETPSFGNDGVPYWLKGETLREWVRLETEDELSDDYEPESPTDWERFR